MAIVTIPDTVRIVFEYEWGGEPVVQIHWGKSSITITPTQLANLAAALKTWWQTYLKVQQHSSLSLQRIYIAEEKEGGLYASVTVNEAGTVTGDSMPASVAQVVTFSGGIRGRAFRGRTYVPGMGEASALGNETNPTYVGALAVAYGQFYAQLAVFSMQHVIVSRVDEGVPRTPPITTNVATYIVTARVDTQRRRLPKA
jgi:hypothetical protein